MNSTALDVSLCETAPRRGGPTDAERRRVQYGIDAPFWVFGFLVGGIALVVAGAILGGYLGIGLLIWGAYWILTGIWMLVSSLCLKRRHAEWLLTTHTPDFGAGRVLDVGTGHGLMLFTALWAADRAGCENAYGTGIDIWSNFDQAGNSAQNTMVNARALGLDSRVTLTEADARSLPFPDNGFDIVVSSYMLHNLTQAEDRATVVREMLRALCPGGTLIITDIKHTSQYAQVAESIPGVEVQLTRFNCLFCLPTRSIIARKAREGDDP